MACHSWCCVQPVVEQDGFLPTRFEQRAFVFALDTCDLTLFYSVILVLILLGGGQICPHPLKMVDNGWEVSKLSWNLISYRD